MHQQITHTTSELDLQNKQQIHYDTNQTTIYYCHKSQTAHTRNVDPDEYKI